MTESHEGIQLIKESLKKSMEELQKKSVAANPESLKYKKSVEIFLKEFHKKKSEWIRAEISEEKKNPVEFLNKSQQIFLE